MKLAIWLIARALLVLSILWSALNLLGGCLIWPVPNSPGYGLVGFAGTALPFQLIAWRSPAWCQFGVVLLTFFLHGIWSEATPELHMRRCSEEVAARFLEQISAGDLDAAYSLSAQGVSREQFEALVEANRLEEIGSLAQVNSNDVRRLTTWVRFTVTHKAASTTEPKAEPKPEQSVDLWVVARRWHSPVVYSFAIDDQEEIALYGQ